MRLPAIPGWVPHLVSLEIRKIISYRADFWISFLAGVLGELTLAYFLWSAMFAALGVDHLGGYSFHAIMLYFLLVPLVRRIVEVQAWGFISLEIYEGTLNRYLVYPVPFFLYKYLTHFAQGLVCGSQCLLAIALFLLLFGTPADTHVSAQSIAMGTLGCLLSGYLYFAMLSCLEMVAFWADNVWSLSVIIRLATSLLGGGLIPLSLFPDWAQIFLAASPFPYQLSYPVRAFLGRMDGERFILETGMVVAWAFVFTAAATLVWRSGTRKYSGVGV